MQQPSLLLRLSRALVGLVTVWCLGCSSYEPLLQSLIDVNVGEMICGSGMGATAGQTASATSTDGVPAHSVIAAPTDSHGVDCGCGGSCHAPSPVVAPRAARTAPIHTAQPSRALEPTSVSRVPLLPPPEITA